jgi:hypothetical protein
MVKKDIKKASSQQKQHKHFFWLLLRFDIIVTISIYLNKLSIIIIKINIKMMMKIIIFFTILIIVNSFGNAAIAHKLIYFDAKG